MTKLDAIMAWLLFKALVQPMKLWSTKAKYFIFANFKADSRLTVYTYNSFAVA